MEKDEIDELIRESHGRPLEILIRLKILNQQAVFHMKQPKKSWKQKYREMWETDFWKEGKKLLKEYFILENGILKCVKCNRDLIKFQVLHHDMYNLTNYMNPLYCEIVCSTCHSRIHKKEVIK